MSLSEEQTQLNKAREGQNRKVGSLPYSIDHLKVTDAGI